MKTYYTISVNMRTPCGFESHANFHVGSGKQRAYEIFGLMKGSENLTEGTVLTMDISSITDGIPLPLKMLGCTIEEVNYNTKIIMREIFKTINLDGE